MTHGQVRDQDYVMIDDGSILAVQGDLHPTDFIVGELAFVPDAGGSRPLRGARFSKAYAPHGRGLPEAARPRLRAPGDSVVHRADIYKHKSIVRRSQVIEHIPSLPWPDRATVAPAAGEYMAAVRTVVEEWFAGDLTGIAWGLTGAVRLSTEEEAVLHDLDVVFRADPGDIRRLVGSISRVAERDPSRRVREHGKEWRIRLRTPAGMLCAFFGYRDPRDTPLATLEAMETVADEVTVSGRIIDDLHNAVLPTLVIIEPEESDIPISGAAGRALPVIISHMRGRGEFFLGDRATFTGALVDVSDGTGTYRALSVVDGTSANLTTPPWPGYFRQYPEVSTRHLKVTR
jgi:predicted nucleotidyltransferase